MRASDTPIEKFAKLMQEKLDENENKGGWEHCTAAFLLGRLKDETLELRKAICALAKGGSPRAVSREAADVANFAMMIADTFGKEQSNASK